MTDEEHEQLCIIGDEFWEEFSALCEKHIARAPPHLKDHYVMFLGEKTSIYGRKTT